MKRYLTYSVKQLADRISDFVSHNGDIDGNADFRYEELPAGIPGINSACVIIAFWGCPLSILKLAQKENGDPDWKAERLVDDIYSLSLAQLQYIWEELWTRYADEIREEYPEWAGDFDDNFE